MPTYMQPHLSLLPSPRVQEGRTRHHLVDEHSTSGFHLVSLEVSIEADVRRLFHALTVPEYIEAWMSLPGERPGCSTMATRTGDDYLIEHSCEGRPSIAISGIYSVCRRRNVFFSWRVDGDLCVPQTEVEIRLSGDFERTRLLLRHKGFPSRHDHVWHGALWTASLEKLASLYGSRDRAAGADNR